MILHRTRQSWSRAISKAKAVVRRTCKDTRVAWLEDGRHWAIYQGAAPRGAGRVSAILAKDICGRRR